MNQQEIDHLRREIATAKANYIYGGGVGIVWEYLETCLDELEQAWAKLDKESDDE